MKKSDKYPIACSLLLPVLLFFGIQISSAQDTTAVQDTSQVIQGGQRIMGEGAGMVETPEQEGQVNFQARDSLTFTFEKNRIATLYGEASVVHSAGQLEAGKVSMNLDSSLVSANTATPEDTLSQPVLTRDNDRIRSNQIDFNYETEKGRFKVARVEVQDGNLIGTKVKNTSPHVVYLEDAIYSTCQLDHPHYYIKADKMKVVDEEEVFFERARLYILDIPYPMIFPFGYLPGKFDQKQSGLLEPTYAYQQRQRRGIGLQNVGWFQYFNDYLTGQISGDIFTSGSYYLDGRVNYRIRNKLNGNFQLGYSRDNSGLEPTDPNFSTNVQKELRISHDQEFSPYSSLNTSIHLRTEDFYQQNSYDPTQRAETSTSSNINYQYRHPEGAYTFNASVRQNQNFATNVTSISGPEISFNPRRLSPFESETPGESKWYETITVDYNNSFRSNYDFDPIEEDSAEVNWFEALRDPSKYREATGNDDHYEFGFRQQVRLNMSQVIPSRFLNVSAGANYNEYWFPTTTRKRFDEENNEVIDEKIRGFTTARDFNTNLSFNTTFYGLSNLNIGKFESFRHTLRPTISLSYRPDFSSDYWGYYRTVQTDTTEQDDGTVPTRRYSIFEDEVFSGPGMGEQRAISFRLANVFEAKKVARDSTGEKKEETISLIEQLDFNTSYNFAADSIKLSNLNTDFRTKVLPGLNLRASAQFNFYERDQNGNKIDNYLLTTSGKLMELTSFSTSTSYSFQWGSQGGLQPNDDPYYPENYNPLNQSIFHPVDPHFNQRPVQDFDSPFSFSVDFSYRWTLNPTGDNRTSATVNARNINLKLTPKWDFRTEIGYDLVAKELTPSQFSLNRNLHCWDLSFTMNPFGDNQYYFFSLSVNAGQLQSIFQKLPGLNNLERSSGRSVRRPPGF